MTTGQTSRLRLTNRGRWVVTLAWLAVLIVGMVTAEVGVPGWSF